jgi:hypothetical protein
MGYFGLKANIGADAKGGHVHSVATSAASVADALVENQSGRTIPGEYGALRWLM